MREPIGLERLPGACETMKLDDSVFSPLSRIIFLEDFRFLALKFLVSNSWMRHDRKIDKFGFL